MAYIRNNYPIGPLTWLKVGGQVKTLFIPKSLDEIITFFQENPSLSMKDIVILGAISNSLILDGYWDKTIIKTTGLNQIILLDDGVSIKAQCGVLDKMLANFALQNSIGGLEFLDSIPGTVGGNIFTNAGCYGSEIKDVVTLIEAIDMQGNLKVFKPEDFQFSYRHSVSPQDILMIYSVTFKGFIDKKENIQNKMDGMKAQRISSQPTGIATCGSTFKNPLHYKSWQLIKDAGADNLQVGGAQWSSIHCNFLHNTGTKANDIYKLCLLTKQMVKEKTNIELELEIFVFGEEE